MSNSSYFTLLRKSKENLQFSNKLIEEFIISKYNEMMFMNNNKATSVEEMQKEISNYYPITTFKYISIKNKNEYDVVFQFHFTSGFNVLKDEFNLNPYNKYSDIIIDLNLAKEMLIAIDYILSRDYSHKFEDILNNYYINVFGDLIPNFQYRFNDKPDLDEFESEELEKEGFYYLKKCRDIIAAYILIEKENTLNEAEYILLYSVA
jgi:hypothetical protein